MKFSKDNMLTVLLGFGLVRNDIFYGTFRDEFQRLFESGIIQKCQANIDEVNGMSEDGENIRLYEKKKKDEVLSWKHLYAGFYLWLGACCLSFLAFISEHVAFRLKVITWG